MRRYGVLAVLIALCFLMPAGARATGSLSIPNIIANQPAGNLQSSLLDANWNAIRDYVNNRELTSGTLSGRPAASTAGRFYFATDVNAGTLYFDNGSAWVQVAPGVQVVGGTFGVRGLSWATATATNTQYQGSATQVMLRSPSDGTVVIRTTDATPTLTNNILTAGPTANGRDILAAFTPPTWLHFYYIWNGTTLATLSSTCAPSDVNGSCSANFGPNLPTGYTHLAYIGPVRMATAGTLNTTWIRGSDVHLVATSLRNSAAGTGVEQIIDVSPLVAPNFLCMNLSLNSTGAANQGDIRYQSSGFVVLSTSIGAANVNGTAACAPFAAQTIVFIGSAASSHAIGLYGYKIPNGGD